MKRLENGLWPLLTLALVVLIWREAVIWTRTQIFPAPWQIVRGLSELMGKGLLLGYVVDSLARVSAGYLAAVVLGVPSGLLLGWYRPAAECFNPVIQIVRPISPLAWTPIAIVWFGVGSLTPVFLIFLASFFPIVVATMNGVRRAPPVFRNAGQNFGLTPAALLRRVILPAALPQILIGLRIALGIAWLVVVAAEMIAVDSGLGYLIIDSRNAGKRYDLVIAGMLLIGLIGLGLDSGMRRIERLPSLRWGFLNE
jgi:NitT/TauT family transport system permease protein